MKHLKHLFTMLLLLCSGIATAQDFEVDGIHYNILSYEDKTVEVTSNSNKYTGAVVVPASVTNDGVAYSVTSIGKEAFWCCIGLTSVEIPNSVTSIGERAFYGCDALTIVEIPNSVTNIEDQAFSYCAVLTSVTIGSSVTRISASAFVGCNTLTNIVVDKNNTVYDSRDNCNAIIHTASNALIAGCKNTVVPNSVTSIGKEAFWRCGGLTSIEIPSCVTSIDGFAFFDCTGLTAIKIPSSVINIGRFAFAGCNTLTNIVVDKNNTVYDSRGNCNAIIETASNTLIRGCKNTVIPNSVTSIEERAFAYCGGLASIDIPESVTSIGVRAFFDCTGLTSIKIPSSVINISRFAFAGCNTLTNIVVDKNNTVYDSRGNCNAIIETASNTLISGCKNTVIPNSVTSIEERAFAYCGGLASIDIPESVTSIGEQAFFCCKALTSITSHIPADKLFAPGEDAFSSVDKTNCTLYVPAGTKATYATTNGWKDFTNIVEF